MGQRMTNKTTSVPTNETLLAVAGTYRLLSRLWLREVDQELAHTLNAEPLRSAYLGVGGALPPTKPAPLECLAQDFCQLFLGPSNHLPAVQSVWCAGIFQSKAVDSMQSFLQILRLENRHPIVDHLGFQLYVMSVAVQYVATARPGANLETTEVAGAFFTNHLSWPSQLIESAHDQAKSGFYASVMDVTANFLCQESEHWVDRR